MNIKYSLIKGNYGIYFFVLKIIKRMLPGSINFYEIQSKTDMPFERFLLYEESKSTISLPNYAYKKSAKYKGIYAYFIKNGILKTNSSCFIQKSKFYVDSIVYSYPYKYGFEYGGFVKRYPFIDYLSSSGKSKFNKLVLSNINLNKKNHLCIEKGIFLGGSGCNNWYHWIIEYLPKLFVSYKLPDKYNSYPLIVPGFIKENKNFMDALFLFNELNRKVLFFNKYQNILVKDLIYIDNIISAPYQIKDNFNPCYEHYNHHDNVLLEYASKFNQLLNSSHLNENSIQKKEKIFLARKDLFRNYNQDKILEISKKYGFHEIYLEKLSLIEQISLFSNAKFVIGPPGAAWTGLIFATENKLGCLSWLPDYLNEACTFSNIAGLLGHRMKFILMKNDSRYNFHFDSYKLDPNLFEGKLKDLIS